MTMSMHAINTTIAEPMVQEEPPIAKSSELVEVKLEQLDDSTDYRSFPSSGDSISAASTSDATYIGFATSGATFAGAPRATTTATTSSQPVVFIYHTRS